MPLHMCTMHLWMDFLIQFSVDVVDVGAHQNETGKIGNIIM